MALVSCGKADETCGHGINPEERKKPRGTCLSRGHRTTVFVIAKEGCLDQLQELYSAAGVGMHVGVVNFNAPVSSSLYAFFSFFLAFLLSVLWQILMVLLSTIEEKQVWEYVLLSFE